MVCGRGIGMSGPKPQRRFSSEFRRSGGPPLTLEQIIDLARVNYPAIQAAQARQRAAQGTIGLARTAYLPRTDLVWQTNRATSNNIYGLLLPQGVISPITGPVIATDVARSAWSSGGGALLSWQPFDFGVRAARVAAAQQGNEAAKQAGALTMLEVSAGAASAFFDLAAARQLVMVAEANITRLETFNRTIHVLVETRSVQVRTLHRQTHSLRLLGTNWSRRRRRSICAGLPSRSFSARRWSVRRSTPPRCLPGFR